ncbi:MAG: hypothetical protein PGN24_04680 [Microbacterium arborescens]
MSPSRILVLGARGAVGAAASRALRDGGHDAIAVSRHPGPGGVAADVTTASGRVALARAAQGAAAVIDASGLEIPEVQDAVGDIPLVDVSATAAHLDRLRRRARSTGTVVAGAGIAPGLSTVLVRALAAQPGDEVDVAVMLGGGERHGDAAVDWTVRLAGADVYAAPEDEPVRNLRSARRIAVPGAAARTHLRADFPDDLLLGRPGGFAVRSWLAMDTGFATGALRVVGALPALAPLLRRAPHVGGEAWRVSAVHRGTGRALSASGEGQSGATGRLAALAAVRLVETGARGVLTMADVVALDELELAGGLRLDRVASLC